MYRTAGKRLYRCNECKRGTYFSKREENRAGRMRCSGCGSAQLTVSAEGAEKQIMGLDARREAEAQVERNGSGSVIPG
ncbi:hypothetical protein VT84_13775 [Gemmata sp. SH-PL17]|uniref:hypothetical protein n=1 Tax=Gemmata sp. SH-PL17 TaxID=1630693 RepID=UPI00078E5217|nr:hypothetical protein [Gemmata sp. SH-PL17]AMV25462.1 hypothetical protein VT84_13775 [Gemmata sp. SH-PL17]